MTTYTWTGLQGALWSDAGNWTPSGGPPGSNDTAKITSSSIVVPDSLITVQTLLNTSGDIEPGEGAGNGLIIENNGSQNSENDATIALEADSTLEIENGTFKNTGQIDLVGDFGANVKFLIANSVSLTGAGEVEMTGGIAGNNTISGTGAGSELTNVNNTIIGSGTIGASLNFTNGTNGTIETNTVGTPGGTIDFVVGQTGFVFTNNGSIIAGNQGSLAFGQDNKVEAFTNNGLIAIEGAGSKTSLVIAGQVSFAGTGEIELVDSGFVSNVIESDGKAAELTTSIPIEGSGTIGDSHLTLNNFSTIGSSDGTLILNTGSHTITNSDNGTIGASFGGIVQIDSPVQNSQGNIAAAEFGVTQIFAAVSGGIVNVEFDGIVELGSGGSVNNGVEFTGSGATLRVDTSASQIAGSISGAASTDNIDAEFVTYASGIQAQWQQNGSTGTLSLVNGGATLASFTLSGQYSSGNFQVAYDGSGGTLIEVVNPPPPPVTTADMIMRNGSNGDYEIYDLGNNAIQAAYALTQTATTWQVAGLGGFDGTDTTDMLLRSGSGAFEIDDVSNNNVTATVSMGQVGQEWVVAGFGDFSGNPGETDMLMRNSNTGRFEVYDISNNTITKAAPMGQVGLEWQVAGFGDFSSHPGETGDMLMRNSNTGQFEVYDISNNTITSAGPMGQVGLEWQVAGFGDFSGNANETDMLMRDTNNGKFEIYDISNNTIASAAPMGQVGMEWQVAGFGPINGAGASDMLMRNVNTGAFEIYDIANNSITNATGMGQVGLEWSVAGIAVDPPTSTAAATTQLMQSMASFAPAGGGDGADTALLPATAGDAAAVSAIALHPNA
ncbi:MAG TPA: hypothetical protein VHD86_09480 [Xanthobacteraceae bacterium]|nr:hypothetical protein [Xanthobacteraceae bacterium]